MNDPRLLLGLLAVLALSAASPRTASAQGCVVRGARASLEDAQVTPPEGSPFQLNVRDAEISARPPGRGDRHPIEVRGALRFSALGSGSAISYRMLRPVRSAAGMVQIGITQHLSRVRAHGAGILLDAEPTPGVHLLDLEVACRSLQLGGPPPRYEEGIAHRSGHRWVARREQLILRERPGEGASLRVRLDHRERWVLRERLSEGAWIRVEWEGDGGTLVEGWVLRAEVEPARSLSHDPAFRSGSGGCHLGITDLGEVYRGPATIRENAEVFAAPGQGRWATVGSAALPFQVIHQPGAPWVRIEQAPGLEEPDQCGTLTHAWVRRADVQLPANARAE